MHEGLNGNWTFLLFHNKTRFGSHGWDLDKINRLGDGIWAEFGLGNAIYILQTLFPRSPKEPRHFFFILGSPRTIYSLHSTFPAVLELFFLTSRIPSRWSHVYILQMASIVPWLFRHVFDGFRAAVRRSKHFPFGFVIFRGQNTYVQKTVFSRFSCMQGLSIRRIKPRKRSWPYFERNWR